MSIEVEIKALLNSDTYSAIRDNKALFLLQTKEKQLNHYFLPGKDFTFDAFLFYLNSLSNERFYNLKYFLELNRDNKISIRTRSSSLWSENNSKLILKASTNNTTSENGTARKELELFTDLPLDKLDEKLLNSGLEYQSCWKRNREEYQVAKEPGVTLCLDCNAGYGYLMELEKMVNTEEEVENTLSQLRAILASLDLTELLPIQLEAMFKAYNQDWAKFYYSGKTFAEVEGYEYLLDGANF